MQKSELPRIVRGKRVRLVHGHLHAPAQGWECKQYRVYGKYPEIAATLKIFGRNRAQVEADLCTVVEHFGCNRSGAWKMALHVLAQAIQQREMRVRVPSTGDGEAPRCLPLPRTESAPRRGSLLAQFRADEAQREKGRKRARRRGPSGRVGRR